MAFFGRSGDLALFVFDNLGVVVDESVNLVVEKGHAEALVASADWSLKSSPVAPSSAELAEASITDLDIHVFSANDRLYTIPKAVQEEAKKALEWRKEKKRGGTPVGMNTARTLAKGGQIGIKKIRHIARYFPRHEVDKKAKGYRPGEAGFPSNGRIAWALWGGDAAQRWASAIVARDNKRKAVTAGGLPVEYFPPQQFELDSFKAAKDLPIEAAPEFMCRCRLDGSGIDRLYMIDADDTLYVWDDGGWDNLGDYEIDLFGIDDLLDKGAHSQCSCECSSNCECSCGCGCGCDGACGCGCQCVCRCSCACGCDTPTMWIPVDVDAAIKIAAMLDNSPFHSPSVEELDGEESLLVYDALSEIDWTLLDDVLVAAGDTKEGGGAEGGDGDYTPKERSENASRQVRDATGKFSKNGSRVVVGGDPASRGVITSINRSDQTVNVKLDNGTTVNVPAKSTQGEDSFEGPAAQEAEPLPSVPAVATQGILAQPRVASDMPNARIPGLLPPITGNSISLLLNDWPAWVAAERELYAQTAPKPQGIRPEDQFDTTSPQSRIIRDPSGGPGRPVAWEPRKAPNAYNHPMLRDWLDKRRTDGKFPNSGWYNPIVTSDVIDDKKSKKAVKNSPSTWYADPNRPGVRRSSSSSSSSWRRGAGGSYSWSKSTSSSTSANGIIAAADAEPLTPENSDVPPVYMAIVLPDDPQAVMDLIALVPVNSKSTTPSVFKRNPGEWVKEDSILADLNSPTPPPVVVLDNDSLAAVVEQIDSAIAASAFYALDRRLTGLWVSREELAAIIAAGGLDRNRGNAEKLRRYWTVGEGGMKIRWGVDGDWTRCVRYLSKHLGPRAKGYCNLRHKEMNGFYPGDRRNENGMEEPIYGNFPVDDEFMDISEDTVRGSEDDEFDYEWEPSEDVVQALAEYDEEDESLLAAGGLDRNRGQAENLRRYWTVGKGGAKIRWGTKGDWTRCVRQLSKYLGPRSKGYCALRHKEMTGMWTGDTRHRKMYGRNAFSTDYIMPESYIVASAITRARVADARERVLGLTASGDDSHGATFFIPLVIPEEMESGDGRKFAKEAIDMRELPLPLMWQIKSGPGHDGSVVVGKITHMERTKQGIGHAYGVFDSGPYGREAERLVRGGFIRGVSADLDRFEANEEEIEASDDDQKKIGTGKINITKARVMAVTLVPKPAFQECSIEIVPDVVEQEEAVVADGVYFEEVDPQDADALVACGVVAGAIPVVPPATWFTNPNLKAPTPLTVDDDGRVFGHIAAWHVDHIGMSFGTRPPRSASKYAYFHTGVVRADDGKDYPVGQLTLAGGHASLNATAAEAVRHYDDTASAIADVHAGEDAHGIWVAGALRPGTRPEQIRALRASAPSGDWRPIKGKLELVAVCQVNVPGFPVARARVASGEVLALVAAGAQTLAKMKTDPVAELRSRIAKLEQLQNSPLTAAVDSARERFHTMLAADRASELSARVAETKAELANFSPAQRERLAKEGKALPDGSYPIRNGSDLKNAIQAYGRSKESDRAKVRRHIIKRARALGKTDLIPDEWKEAAELEAVIASLRERVSELAAEEPVADPNVPTVDDLVEEVEEVGLPEPVENRVKYTARTQPRDARGKFRQVLARIKQDLGVSGNANALDKIAEAENLDFAGDYEGSVKAAQDLLEIIDRLDSGALNPTALVNVRESAGELGRVIANLPFAFGEDAQKIRYSDIPPALQGLIEDMIDRVERKIGSEDAKIATETLRKYKSGSKTMSQSGISSEMAKLLRLLT